MCTSRPRVPRGPGHRGLKTDCAASTACCSADLLLKLRRSFSTLSSDPATNEVHFRSDGPDARGPRRSHDRDAVGRAEAPGQPHRAARGRCDKPAQRDGLCVANISESQRAPSPCSKDLSRQSHFWWESCGSRRPLVDASTAHAKNKRARPRRPRARDGLRDRRARWRSRVRAPRLLLSLFLVSGARNVLLFIILL